MAQGNAAYTCPVSFDLILGAKPHKLSDLQTALTVALRVKATTGDWDIAAQVAAILRRKGMIFPALELLVAAVACAGKVPLLRPGGAFYHDPRPCFARASTDIKSGTGYEDRSRCAAPGRVLGK